MYSGNSITYDTKYTHGTYVKWYSRNKRALKEESLSFDLFKACEKIKSSRRSDFFSEKTLFLYVAQPVLSYHLI